MQVLIAGAGGAAHLPGMAAAKTALPVLGVPVESKALKGMDSLLSIVQMPAGVPVGTLAIGRAGAVNAALLAAAIVARSDDRRARAAGALPRRADADACSTRPTRPRDARRLHRRRAARPDARRSPESRSGSRFRFLDPSPDAPAAPSGSCSSAPTTIPISLDRLADGADAVTYEFENVPVEAARRVGRGAGRRGARGRAGPPRREAALPPPRHPDGPRSTTRDRVPGAR